MDDSTNDDRYYKQFWMNSFVWQMPRIRKCKMLKTKGKISVYWFTLIRDVSKLAILYSYEIKKTNDLFVLACQNFYSLIYQFSLNEWKKIFL